ncbi:MAG: radical SAM protein [bacterium]|nr:radical SAM protein [bacterium]
MDPIGLLKDTENTVDRKIKIALGKNKKAELVRLVHEICRREKILPESIFQREQIKQILEAKDKGKIFFCLKKRLLEIRYPYLNQAEEKFETYFVPLRLESEMAAINQVAISSLNLDYGINFFPKNIFVEQAVKTHPFTQKVLAEFPEAYLRVIDSLKSYQAQNRVKNRLFAYNRRNENLFIIREKGDYFKPCPCTSRAQRCGYHIFNLGFGCVYDCSYCYLQHYDNFYGLVLCANLEDFFAEFDRYQFRHQGLRRIGTGEFTDSLALDHITGYSVGLIEFFARRKVLFELKTKSTNIANLEGLAHNQKTVISWSLNPDRVASCQELGTASLLDRLKAAKQVRAWGYPVGFHFDPIIYFEGWQRQYEELIELMFEYIKDGIAWISLGTLRFHPGLKPIMENRFPQSDIVYGELILGKDGKMRYPDSLRIDMYRQVLKMLGQKYPQTNTYLCMEPREIWEKTYPEIDKYTRHCYKLSFNNVSNVEYRM